jgi:hypothetical protein
MSTDHDAEKLVAQLRSEIEQLKVRVEEPQANPFLRLWALLGTIGGVIGLSSMVQDWANDLVQWRGFIAEIVGSYRSLVRLGLDVLLGWTPFVVPYWVGDYFVVGGILSSGFVASMLPTYRGLAKRGLYDTEGGKIYGMSPVSYIYIVGMLMSLVWPLFMVLLLLPELSGEKVNPDNNDLFAWINRWRWWLATVLLVFLLLLAINSQLPVS